MDAETLQVLPHPVLTPLTLGESPSFSTLSQLQGEMNSNAMALYSTGGNSLRGHLVLTMDAAAFALLENPVPHPPPDDPGPPPVEAGTAAVVAAATLAYKTAVKAFRSYHRAEYILRSQLIAACPRKFLAPLFSDTMGFALTNTRAMLSHLWTAYGHITIAELSANSVALRAAWNPPSTFEDLLEQLFRAEQFATSGGIPFGDATLVLVGYELIYATGLFNLACREWRTFEPPAQTMALFQEHFKRAIQDHQLTASTAGFHGANNATLPPASDLAALALKHQQLVDAMAALKASLVVKKSSAARKARPPADPNAPTSYCWSHGTSTNLSHDSGTCENQAPGHQHEATATNKMGSSTRIYKARSPPAAAPL